MMFMLQSLTLFHIPLSQALASKTDWDWDYSTESGAIGNDLTKNSTSGFTALSGGLRYNYGSFYSIGKFGYWWSFTEVYAGSAFYRYLYYNSSYLYSNYYTG